MLRSAGANFLNMLIREKAEGKNVLKDDATPEEVVSILMVSVNGYDCVHSFVA